jgi:hypothetical protein
MYGIDGNRNAFFVVKKEDWISYKNALKCGAIRCDVIATC